MLSKDMPFVLQVRGGFMGIPLSVAVFDTDMKVNGVAVERLHFHS